MSTFHCVVATPSRKLFDGEVNYVSVPGCEGYYGVMAGHELMVSLNQFSGVCTINIDEAGADQKKFLISEGATQMYNGILTVLGRFGRSTDDIDRDYLVPRIDEMKKHIAELEQAGEGAQDEVELESSRDRLAWYEMQLKFVDGN